MATHRKSMYTRCHAIIVEGNTPGNVSLSPPSPELSNFKQLAHSTILNHIDPQRRSFLPHSARAPNFESRKQRNTQRRPDLSFHENDCMVCLHLFRNRCLLYDNSGAAP